MKIAIFGSGYVGLVTAACLAETGHVVNCVDIDANRVAQLQKGVIPIFEPGLSDLIIRNHANNHIDFTTDAQHAIEHADIIFIAVGTPAQENGEADLRAVFQVADTIFQYAESNTVVIIKSTVPIGTTDQIQKQLASKKCCVVFNPEFLKQGNAVQDAMHPDRIIVGMDSNDNTTIDILKKLYRQFYSDEKKFLVMSTRSAEMTKYAANAMLATKISFINEMSQIADRVGADIYAVRDGIALDERIGPHFINPGLGYGGSCFPKDIKALQYTANSVGYHARILDAVDHVNFDQKLFLFDKIMRFYQGNIVGKVFAIWGLAFKPNTDDLRDAASIVLIEKLWENGAFVQAYDPEAMQNFEKKFGDDKRYCLCDSMYDALKNADALCVVTEWDEFKTGDATLIADQMKDKAIFDGRGVFKNQRKK